MRKDDNNSGFEQVIGDRYKTSSVSLDRTLGKKDRPIIGWRIAFLILCTVGVILSADLLRLHFKVFKDPNYHAFCAMSEQVNCETVAISKYAVFAGLPVAIWGLLGYFFMGGLCVWGFFNHRQPTSWPFGILFCLSLFSALVSIALFIISHFLIHSFCIICAGAYLTNFLLCGLTLGDLRHLKSGPFAAVRSEIQTLAKKKFSSLLYVAPFVAILLAFWFFLPTYWQVGIMTGPGGLLVGNTAEGFHWIGARAPVVDIVEFSDYQCPHCGRGHMEIRTLIRKHPDKIRLIHRHYPLRRHPYAFDYSKLAYCSGKQDHFWEANDYLFKTGRRSDPVTPKELAAAIQISPKLLSECVDSKEAQTEVANDIAAARALNIRRTPTYVVGNKTYPGRIPKKVISAALQQKQNK